MASSKVAPVLVPEAIDSLIICYEQGFWIRGIGFHKRTLDEAVSREVEILDRRERMPDSELDAHRPGKNLDESPEYFFSPSTFVKAGVHVALFKGDTFGLIIQTSRTIPAWCSGLSGHVMTEPGNDVNFSYPELKFNYNPSHQISGASSSEISSMLSRLYFDYVSNENSAVEKYDECVSPSGLPYNEGLFRYRKNHVKGIVVCEIPKSCYYAIKFCRLSKMNSLRFYKYNPIDQIQPVSRELVEKLATQYNPEKESISLLSQFSVATTASRLQQPTNDTTFDAKNRQFTS